MGEVRSHRPVLLIVAAFSRHSAALTWAEEKLEESYGPIAHASPNFVFNQTRFYQAEMGSDLTKKFFTFQQLIDPATLPAIKRQTNALEAELAESGHFPEQRPLNLDPGYVTEAKLILATTKDRDHRIYLADGIYAEGTLYFHDNAWRTRPWTYPDFATSDYHRFLTVCRDYLRARYRTDS